MSPPSSLPITTPRAASRRTGEETRAAILAAAERHFAERGFEAARLEDIAADVGIRRAAIFYHFPDKRELYMSVLDDALGSVALALPTSGSIEERLETAMGAWIDYVARRPTVARLILREAASAQRGEVSALARAGGPLVRWLRALIDQGVTERTLEPLTEPHRVISLMGVATIFHFASRSALTPDVSFGPSSAADHERHKAETLRVARRMLGFAARE